MKLTKNESKTIIGGVRISATLINSLIRGVNSFMDIGRYIGSSIRRMFGTSCPLR